MVLSTFTKLDQFILLALELMVSYLFITIFYNRTCGFAIDDNQFTKISSPDPAHVYVYCSDCKQTQMLPWPIIINCLFKLLVAPPAFKETVSALGRKDTIFEKLRVETLATWFLP